MPPNSYNTTVVVIFVFSSSLSAFYMRSFAEKVSDIKPPLLQVTNHLNSSFFPFLGGRDGGLKLLLNSFLDVDIIRFFFTIKI